MAPAESLVVAVRVVVVVVVMMMVVAVVVVVVVVAIGEEGKGNGWWVLSHQRCFDLWRLHGADDTVHLCKAS
jgi:hypothetical protein